jgi:hypothetical protein
VQLKNSLTAKEITLSREILARRAEVHQGLPILWAEMKGHRKVSIIFFVK